MIGQTNEYNKMKILGVGKSISLGVHRGVVNNITQTIQSIQQAVSEAEEISGFKVDAVTVGIAGQHIRSLQHSDYITRNNSEQVIDENDIERLINQVHKLVMLPGEEIIHVLPQEFKVDGQAEIKEPIGMYGGRLEANFHVVVGQVSSIRNIGRCIKSAGLDLDGITLEPRASANAVLSHEEKEAGVALIDIGGGTTDLAIFKDGIIRHTAVIPFGGNVVTEDIKEGCSIIEKQAELLKVKFGSAWPHENKENEILKSGLEILAYSKISGIGMVRCPKTKDLFILNHLEYDAITLKEEFLRDKLNNSDIDIPSNYFPNDDINKEPINRWRPYRYIC